MSRMQCKNIPDRPVLEFLAAIPRNSKNYGTYPWGRHDWANWCYGNDRDVHRAMPTGTPDKLVLAKMRVLMRRGLVDGCSCGCRGDFAITPKGEQWLERSAE